MCIFNPNRAWLKIYPLKNIDIKNIGISKNESIKSKMSYSESEPGFYSFAINSLSIFAPIFSVSESDDSESDFNSVFLNLDICVFFYPILAFF